LIIVITNQSGIARGMYLNKDVKILHNYINKQLLKIDCCILGAISPKKLGPNNRPAEISPMTLGILKNSKNCPKINAEDNNNISDINNRESS
jgi:hypothetical protein